MRELSTSEAVRAYGTHPNVLLRLILTGKLEAHKNGDGRWLISKESLERWNRQRVRRAPRCEQPGVAVSALHAHV
jgi:excisionase family DNA binding protein